MKKLLLLILLHVSIFAKECYIQDMVKHKENQKLLQTILSENPNEDINQIGARLLQRGFYTDAYAVPKLDDETLVEFNCFTLWEGKTRPVTYFVYVWPSKEYAESPYSASNIHSHPITCSFTVLQGSITQNNYEPIAEGSKVVHKIGQKTFTIGTGDSDNANTPFIHRLCNLESKTCISLHAYGEPTAKKVMETFRETSSKHTYQLEK